MPIRLFITYFVALVACSTFAFASFGPDPAAPLNFAFNQPPYPLSAPGILMHHHKIAPRHPQMAQADSAY